ncbi:hypothetical protein J5X84_39460 [Streptosporangiaceae bacterium NEAU-GS5]|nr:hypothetical protein [Streptosporangiaceae bacterium NEAU-GS5]
MRGAHWSLTIIGLLAFGFGIPISLFRMSVSYGDYLIAVLIITTLAALALQLIALRASSFVVNLQPVVMWISVLLAGSLWLLRYGESSWLWLSTRWLWLAGPLVVLILASAFIAFVDRRLTQRSWEARIRTEREQERIAKSLQEVERSAEEEARAKEARRIEAERMEHQSREMARFLHEEAERKARHQKFVSQIHALERVVNIELAEKIQSLEDAVSDARTMSAEEITESAARFLARLYSESSGLLGRSVPLRQLVDDGSALGAALLNAIHLEQDGLLEIYNLHIVYVTLPVPAFDDGAHLVRSYQVGEWFATRATYDFKEYSRPGHVACAELWCETVSLTRAGINFLRENQIRTKTQTIGATIVHGDSFNNVQLGPHAVLQNRSRIDSSLFAQSENTTRSLAGDDGAVALQELKTVVEASGNRKAIDLFDRLIEELHRNEPNRTIIKAFWNGLVEALPTVNGLVEIGAKLAGIFS